MERTINLENVTILPGSYRNFAGRPTKFIKNGGARSFCIRLDPEQAQWFKDNGFNVQERANTVDPDAPITYVLSIKVSYNKKPPLVVMINGNRGTRLSETTIANLDYAEIEKADIVIGPNEYDMNGMHGYSAYLNTMYVTIAENPYAEKYKDLVMNSDPSDMDDDPMFE